MPKVVKPLTYTEISNAKANGKVQRLNDGNGLALTISPQGAKRWALRYSRPYNKARTEMSLGAFPAVSLSQARDKAREAQTQLAMGNDPQLLKRLEVDAGAKTFQSVSGSYITRRLSNTTPAHRAKIERSLKTYILPSLGGFNVADIQSRVVLGVLDKIADKHSVGLAYSLCVICKTVLDHAVNMGLIKLNPLVSLAKIYRRPPVKHRATLPASDVKRVLSALEEVCGKNKRAYSLAVFQLHTMVRPSEAASAMWSEIDLNARTWTIPADKMKARREHTVYLSGAMISLLHEQHTINKSAYIFPQLSTGRKPMHTETVTKMLRRSSVNGLITAHGFRAMASTHLNESNFNSDAIEMSLAHIETDKNRAAYNRATYVSARKEIAEYWSSFIINSTTDTPPKATLSVVPFRRNEVQEKLAL